MRKPKWGLAALIFLFGVLLSGPGLLAVPPVTPEGPVITQEESERPQFRHHRAKRFSRDPNRLLKALRTPELQERLGLSQDQIDRLREREYEASSRQIEIRAQLDQKRLDLQRVMESDYPDRGEVNRLIEELGLLQTQLHQIRAGLMLDLRETLTEDQQQQLRQLVQERRQRRRGPR